MPLIRDGRFVPDPWAYLADEGELPGTGAVIVSRARFDNEREALLARGGPLGLCLKSDESPVALATDVHRFQLIAISFPQFKDGRGFSYARRLREQMGFAGALRARGHILPDQAQFLARCGFDEFEVKEGAKLSDWQRGLTEISVWYQAVGDRRPRALDLRLQRQSPAPAARASRMA
jgi:uncharacterized protein (DUF934 family)